MDTFTENFPTFAIAPNKTKHTRNTLKHSCLKASLTIPLSNLLYASNPSLRLDIANILVKLIYAKALDCAINLIKPSP